MEYSDKLFLTLLGGATVFVGLVVYMVFIPKSSERVARETADAARLGKIWGQIETAQSRCPGLVINGPAAQKLLTQVAAGGERGLAVMSRLSAMPEWYDAYRAGEKEAKKLNESKPGEAFCQEMITTYGPTGTVAANLLKARAPGEERPRFF